MSGNWLKKTAQKVKKTAISPLIVKNMFCLCFVLWGLFYNDLLFVRESCDILDCGGKDCLAKYDLAYKTGRF
ncbi:hypothetical protein [Klebsiella michiganensis]|uniref:hypothetical protein n=1 Tax=Klebsiella michiganensis TaxID=1134687 RepID=UPI001CCE59B8|nr:hypothetical protein [Klebsiella michiganensis]